MRAPPSSPAVAHGEAHQLAAEPMHARGGQHGQPVALPQPVARAGRAAPCRRPRRPPARPRAACPRVVVVRVAVGAREQPLRLDEHGLAHGEVRGELALAGDDARRASGGRPRRGHRSRARPRARSTRSQADSPEHAWQRAQPAFASRWSKPGVREHRRHLAVDAGDVVRIGRRRVRHQRPRHRPQRHDERVHAHLDRPPAALEDQLRAARPCRAGRRS